MPKVVDVDERRELIARAAAELISENGVEGATIREVAKRAGATRGLVEHYFSSKAEMIESALDWLNSRYKKRILRAVNGQRGLAAIRARFESSLPKTPVANNEWRLRLRFWSSRDKEFNRIQRKQLQTVLKILEADVADACTLGEIPAVTSHREIAHRIMYVLSGLSTMVVADSATFDRDCVLRELDHQFDRLRKGVF